MDPRRQATTRIVSLTRAALDLLPSVLAAIQRASKVLERDVNKDDRALLDGFNFLGLAASSLSLKLSMLRDAGLDAKLAAYALEILEAVEVSVCEEVLECAPSEVCACENSAACFYPKSHALGHQTQINSTDRRPSYVYFFPDPPARDALLCRLKETYDELDARFTDPSESSIPPATKRRCEPQWGISDFTCKVFCALACRHDPSDCGFDAHSNTRLALATYSDMTEEEDHFVDVLFGPAPQTPLWVEVRIHKHSPAPTRTRPAVTKVVFADRGGKSASMAREWWKKTPDKLLSFCNLLGPNKKNVLLTNCRLNVAVDRQHDIWRHNPTDTRFLKENESPHSISLSAILAPNTGELNGMAKLVLAVTLAYSLFYLYEGPWLRGRNVEALSRENITFFKKDGRVPIRPFLCSDICGIDGEDIADDDSFHPYPVILGFGVILLEIHLGRTLESFLNLEEPLTSLEEKWICAYKVFREKKTFIFWPNYRNVIESCLSLNFGMGNEDEDGLDEADEKKVEKLRGLIFSTIVEPLLDDLEYSFGGKSGYIELDNIDKEAASMDLGSGLSAVESEMGNPTTHPTHSAKSTQDEISSRPKKRLKTKATITPYAVSKESDSPRFAPDSPKLTNTGEMHTIFGDPEELPSHLSSGNKRTDKWITEFKQLEVLKLSGPHRVRIAIIDSGIDMDHVDIIAAFNDDRIRKVCDWVDGHEGREHNRMTDTLGHGTHIASIILNLTPNVELYIARVTKSSQLSDSQAENVAKALRTAASTWGCAIINLSLGFHHGIKCIEDALKDVTKAGVLVFAAASNDGYSAGLAYPAWHPQVLCIYSSTEYGRPSEFNPSADNQNNGGVAGFSILGEHIDGAWPTNLSRGQNDRTRRMSGTSFATPVAVAVAACVLGFSCWGFKPGELEACHCKLKSNDGMRRVLLMMVKKTFDRYQCLDPSAFFKRKECLIVEDIKRALNPKQ